MAQQYFKIDGIQIRAPDTYKPVYAVTSTDDSDRTQDGVMHNTPMFSVAGYDMTWGPLHDDEISTILRLILGRSRFSFYHKSPISGWTTSDFYASNFSMAAQDLEEGNEMWEGLAINVRSIRPV